MKNRLKIFGNIWHDTGIILIGLTFLVCLIYGWALGFPEGFPDREHVKPILWITCGLTFIYFMSYIVIDLKILLSEGPEDDTPDCPSDMCERYGCLSGFTPNFPNCSKSCGKS